jgi:Kef-type K+ transport system membrane component KefB
MITRAALRGREVTAFESQLTAVGFGFLIPFFFVASGLAFDLEALGSVRALAEVPMFLALFLVVRGAPALLLYRRDLASRERLALGVFSATQLPLVVAIATVAVDGGHMRSSTAAALVGAALLSTLILPFIGLALRRGDDVSREAGGRSTPGPSGSSSAALRTG